MRFPNRSFAIAAFAAAAFALSAKADKVPAGNLAVMTQVRLVRSEGSLDKIIAGLDQELHDRGFAGKLRITNDFHADTLANEKHVTLILARAEWSIRKAFSIPYLLNRYRRVFSLEVAVEIGRGGDSLFFERIDIAQGTKTRAQLMTNDRYNPDTYPDQSGRLEIEEKAYRDMAAAIVDKLGERLK
jgi:hypothetical protein